MSNRKSSSKLQVDRDDEYYSTPRPSATSYTSDKFTEFTDNFTLNEEMLLKDERYQHNCTIFKTFFIFACSVTVYTYLMAEPKLYSIDNFAENLLEFLRQDWIKIMDSHENINKDMEMQRSEKEIVGSVFHMIIFCALFHLLARIMLICSKSTFVKVLNTPFFTLYILSIVYFGFKCQMHSINYLRASYWNDFEWKGFKEYIEARTIVQVVAWIIITISVYFLIKIVLFGIISIFFEKWAKIKDMFYIKSKVYNPFENEKELCQRLNCGYSLYQCEDCICIDGKYYFHNECAKVELVQNNYKQLYSQQFNEYIQLEYCPFSYKIITKAQLQ